MIAMRLTRLLLGEGLVLNRDEAYHFGLSTIHERLDPQVTVQQQVFPWSLRSGVTTAGSTIPTSPIDATICAYLGDFLTLLIRS
jgi:hypothetical protein